MKPATIESVTGKYLQLSGHKIGRDVLSLQLTTHPDYPSLKSVSDTLDYFKVAYAAVEIPKESLDELPKYFIAQINGSFGHTLVLVEKFRDKVRFPENGTMGTQSIDIFLKNWTGIVLVVDENENVIDGEQLLKYVPIATFSILLIVSSVGRGNVTMIFSFLNLLGAILAYFIVRESLGNPVNAVSTVCHALNPHSGCDAIRTDKLSFSGINIADLPGIYFTANLVFVAFNGLQYALFAILGLMGLCVAMVSIGYQASKIRRWCVLCIGICAVLLLQAGVTLPSMAFGDVRIPDLSGYLLLFAGFAIAWSKVKALIFENTRLRKEETAFLRMRRDQAVFQASLKKKPMEAEGILPRQITFGSSRPQVMIDAVTSPFCTHCAVSFAAYRQLLKVNSDAAVNLVFNIPEMEPSDPASCIGTTIIGIYLKKGQEAALDAIEDWYALLDVTQWHKKYEAYSGDSTVHAVLDSHEAWLRLNDIHYAPLTMVDGYHFPAAYKVSDLPLLYWDGLREEVHAETINEIGPQVAT